jgi:hypothetical protein
MSTSGSRDLPGGKGQAIEDHSSGPAGRTRLILWEAAGTRPVKPVGRRRPEAAADPDAESSEQSYSNRVPTAVAQPVPITAPLTSRISMAERDANASPPAPSSNVAVIFCDPRKTPLAEYR